MKIEVVIKFTSPGSQPAPDLRIPLSVNPDKDDVNKLVSTSWIKLVIRSKMAWTAQRRLRLIYNGRVLNDQTNYKNEILMPRLKQHEDPLEPMVIYVHCLIGDKLTAAQLAEEREMDHKAQEAVDAPVIGFDRLLLQGVSVQDVNDLRRQFQQVYLAENSRNVLGGVADIEEDENRQAYIRQLEEQWLESTNGGGRPGAGAGARASGSRTDPDTNMPGNAPEPAAMDFEGPLHNEELLVGLLMGTFLGAVAIVFLMMDDTLFSDTHKMAMILGVIINFLIALMRVGTIYGV